MNLVNSEDDAQSIRIPTACMVALTCFEIFGLITGISIFNVRAFLFNELVQLFLKIVLTNFSGHTFII